MEKSKKKASYPYHMIVCILIAILLFTSLRLPIVFLDTFYRLTRILYFVVSVIVIAYGTWLLRRLRMRYIAVFIIGVALICGAINVFRFSLPFETSPCDQYTPTYRVCFMSWVEYDSLTYAHWKEVNMFYTLPDWPVGIWYKSTFLE